MHPMFPADVAYDTLLKHLFAFNMEFETFHRVFLLSAQYFSVVINT